MNFKQGDCRHLVDLSKMVFANEPDSLYINPVNRAQKVISAHNK